MHRMRAPNAARPGCSRAGHRRSTDADSRAPFCEPPRSFPEWRSGRGEIELDDRTSLAELIERLEIPDPLAQMVLVDGLQEPRSREARARRILEDGQTVSIFPPVAGG